MVASVHDKRPVLGVRSTPFPVPAAGGTPAPVTDRVPSDSYGSIEIGFDVPERYNASDILFQNLARGHGDRLAVTGPGGQRSYSQLCADAARWGNALLSLGLVRGDRVLLLLDDTAVYPAVFFGAVRAGLVPLLINVLTPPELLQFYLSDSGARVAVAEARLCDRFDATACANMQVMIIVNGAANTPFQVRTKSAAEWLSCFPERLPAADTHRNEMAFWMYSSGSTGRPKGVVHLQHDMAYTDRSYARSILKLTSDDVCFSVPKIFFSYGFGNSITFTFSAGAASLLLPGHPTPAAVFAAIAQYRPTVFYGLPTLYTALTKAAEAQKADFSSLRLAISAAEVLSAEVFNDWKRLTGLEIIEGLGSTEVLNIYLSNTADKKKLGAAGMRVPGYELVLKDQGGNEVGNHSEGILWVRGHSNTPCYWNRPSKTAETIREGGWIYTGDRFVRDGDGFYFFRGRSDDLVKISGQWVNPLEVQLCLAEHPSVQECAVVALELPDRRMTLKAFVVMKDAPPESEQVTRMLQDHVKRKLLPYKYPRIIELLPELPKTGTGKIDRQALLNGTYRVSDEISLSPPRAQSITRDRDTHMSKSSLALGNLRSSVILLVVGFHSALAYLGSQPASQPPFDSPPYDWLAFPIRDAQRWFGFDLFCAFQYVFLMPFMFFLSGLFVWPSLVRKGSTTFVRDRIMRLGVPFVLGVLLLMPLAHYPVYRVTAHDPSWSAFWAHLRALPFWPSGPLWFLWQLLAFNIAAATLYRFVPGAGDFLGRLSMTARELPSRYFTLLLAISCLAYLPLAWKFKPWEWTQFGPFSLQPGRLLHYLVYFLAGASAGMHGLERGLLSSDGMLAKHWGRWVSGGLAAFLLWIIATALTMQGENAILPHLGIVADLAFVLSSASVCFGFAAIFLRLAAKPWPAFETLSENSYGIYLVHYVFVVWLQYLLLGLTLIAVAKGAIVFTGALMLSWAIAATISRVPIGNRLLGAKR